MYIYYILQRKSIRFPNPLCTSQFNRFTKIVHTFLLTLLGVNCYRTITAVEKHQLYRIIA